MTEQQQDALDKACEILSEHFDHHAVIVGWEDDAKAYNTAGSWSGGVPTAIGLCDLYHEKLTRLHLGSDAPSR